jgi:molybdopterin-guanine dinucleotide biosynthesis protein A
LREWRLKWAVGERGDALKADHGNRGAAASGTGAKRSVAENRLMQPCGGIVLAGGRSSRMGLPKALLPFGPERMLQRVVRLLREVVQPIVVVAAHGQSLPELPADVAIVCDERQSSGPLEGLRAGLAALAGHVQRAYASSCDVPLLHTSLVRHVIELAEQGNWQIAVPRAEGFHHPLAAVYDVSILPAIERLLAADRLRPVFLFDEVRTLVIEAEQLRPFDPQLDSLRNLNRPVDYVAALAMAGFAIDPEVASQLHIVDD